MCWFIKRVLLIISFLSTIFIYSAPCPVLAALDPEASRVEMHQSITRLDADADTLAQELLAMDLKSKKAEQKRELIKKELADTQKKRDDSYAQYNVALQARQSSLKKLGPWLNFQYRYGYWSLINTILGSSSLPDMISRTVTVTFILKRQMDAYSEARASCEISRQKEQSLKYAADQLALQSAMLDNQINEIKNIADRRREYLEKIKMTSADLAQKVTAIETKFLQTLDLYSFLTTSLANIPWQEIEPDSVNLNADGIMVEISENSLNRCLQTSGNEEMRSMFVNLQTNLFSLSGKENKSSSTFTLSGLLVPQNQSTAVKFELTALDIDEIPVNKEVLGQMPDTPAFQLPLPEGLKLLDITMISKINIIDKNIIFYLK